MRAYKGFNPDMTCRGFRYEEGKTYETDKADLCNAGFHACEAPLNVWDYYPPTEGSRYCEVEMADVSEQRDSDTKRVAKKITIGAEIGVPGLVKAHVEWVKEQIKDCDDLTGYAAQIGSSGRYAQIGSSGDDAIVICEADHAAVSCIGKRGKIKAPVGTWITLAEYGDWDGNGYPCICVKSAQVDGKTLKADTFYTLRNGEFVEVPDEDQD